MAERHLFKLFNDPGFTPLRGNVLTSAPTRL
ncbi:MAG: hypothetical protein JWL84_2543 [Rhodospirillales bacterium]|nr:hypothetical protein [Rhodospirillales bacterium]